MRRKLAASLLITVLLVFVLARESGSGSAGDEKEVRALISLLGDAGMKRDVALIDRIYAADYFHTNTDGSVMTKEQVLASYRSPSNVSFDSNEHTEDRVIIHGDMAVVSGTVTLRGRMGAQAFVRTWRTTYMLRKESRRWQIVASHASVMS
jgi:ketosteroid isomerase-like protein